ncbi:MAG: hypothetical protein HY565_04000 [Candidatus Kerfeldbacteria bacterium]|nr:hypothetical protein [Candidatus Kerfeldbacteria bacterium]
MTMPAHADIRYELTLGGQAFEAVGFLAAGEESVRGEEAIRRCDNGHLIRSEDDWHLLYKHRSQLPQGLVAYWLVTARPNPGYPRDVSSLDFDSLEWYDRWNDLDNRWDRDSLVVRRRM